MDPVQIRPVVEVDQQMVEMLETVLARVKAGEQFAGLAIVLVDSKGFAAPYTGKLFEILTGAARLMNKMQVLMDQD